MGKYFSGDLAQNERQKGEVCTEKAEGNPLDRTNQVNKEFIVWLLVPSFMAVNELFSS